MKVLQTRAAADHGALNLTSLFTSCSKKVSTFTFLTARKETQSGRPSRLGLQDAARRLRCTHRRQLTMTTSPISNCCKRCKRIVACSGVGLCLMYHCIGLYVHNVSLSTGQEASAHTERAWAVVSKSANTSRLHNVFLHCNNHEFFNKYI